MITVTVTLKHSGNEEIVTFLQTVECGVKGKFSHNALDLKLKEVSGSWEEPDQVFMSSYSAND